MCLYYIFLRMCRLSNFFKNVTSLAIIDEPSRWSGNIFMGMIICFVIVNIIIFIV